ncbi:MAG: DUF975 family protein, partial [Bacillota bacterium]
MIGKFAIYKKKGREIVKKKYALLMILCLLAIVLQMEYSNIGVLPRIINPNLSDTRDSSTNLTMPWVQDQISDLILSYRKRTGGKRVLKDSEIEAIKMPKGLYKIPRSRQEIIERYQGRETWQNFKKRGALFMLDSVNKVLSTHILIQLLESARSISTADNTVSILMIIFSLLLYLQVWTFFINVLRAVLRRVFLEAAIYEQVPYHRIFHFMQVGHAQKASLTMLLVSLCRLLWNLTLVGGFIKYFSYFAVPYIVAENPGIGAKDAIRISKEMMKGHKWECFLLHLSFFGWYILSILTAGISDLFYFCPYRLATLSTYYTNLRAGVVHTDGFELLDDDYLFSIAPEAERGYAYPKYRQEGIAEAFSFSPFRKRILRRFGIWIGSSQKKKIYQEKLNRLEQRKYNLACAAGKCYPVRLNKGYCPRFKNIAGKLSYKRCYTFWSLVSMMFSLGILGWLWETILHLIQTGAFVNRGIMHGPWLPIYGLGSAVVVILLHRLQKNPLLLFSVSMALCGGLEYAASYILECIYHVRWWDYTERFLNLNGRICLEGVLVFGVASVLMIYIIGPLHDTIVSQLNPRILMWVCLILLAVFLCDFSYSRQVPNVGEGVTRIRNREGNYVQYDPE